jgi:hypothetical protein
MEREDLMLATEALPKAGIEQLRGTQFVADKGGNIHFEILVAETKIIWWL